MRSINAISFASLLTASYAELVATPVSSDPTITPAPEVPVELLRKQNDGRFMGWIYYNGNWTTRACDTGGTLYRSKDYWRCCATTVASCNVPIGCVSGSLVYSFSTGTVTKGTYACTDIYTASSDASFTMCNTGLMYENSADSNPESNFFCGISAINWSYYRSEPAEAIAATQSKSSSSGSPTATVTSTSASAASASASPSQTSSPAPEKSKAWIAGAVIGPLAGLAIIGAGLWFCLRRKNKKTAPATGAAAVPPTGPAPSYPGSPQQGYYQPMEQKPPNDAGFVPYGVGVNEQKHQSGYYDPQSPNTQQSHSPAPPSPYNQQGYSQPVAQPTGPQMLGSDLEHQQGYSAPNSPQPQHNDVKYAHEGTAQPHVNNFSSELEGTPYSPPNIPMSESNPHPVK